MTDSSASKDRSKKGDHTQTRPPDNRGVRDWSLIGASTLIHFMATLSLITLISVLPQNGVGVIGGIMSTAVILFATWMATGICKTQLVEGVESSIRRAGKTIGEGGFVGMSVATVLTIAAPSTAPLVSGGESTFSVVGAAALFTAVSFEYYRPHLASQLVDSVEVGGRSSEAQFVREKEAPWNTEPRDTSNYNPMDNNQHTDSQKNEKPNTSSDSQPEQSERVAEQNTPTTESIDMSNTEYDWQIDGGPGFEAVGGMQSIKSELHRDVITPLVDRKQKAEELGISAPNIVFYGPPGTGKTFIAQALATELELPFTKLSGADVQSKWINESAGKVKTLFHEAKMLASEAGGAVIFLDEIDSVLKSRADGSGDHGEDKKVVNEFLNHLEETEEHDIVFIGATNRVEALDEAGTRSGRIDKKIKIGKPDSDARAAVFRAQLTDLPHNVTSSQIAQLADKTEGCVPADIEMIVESAAKRVLYNDSDVIRRQDIIAVIQTRE